MVSGGLRVPSAQASETDAATSGCRPCPSAQLSPTWVAHAPWAGAAGPVEQTVRWTTQVPFGKHLFQVLFRGEISPTAATLWVSPMNGFLRRLTQACRKVTDVKLIELLRTSLLTVPINPTLPPFGQLRFDSSA